MWLMVEVVMVCAGFFFLGSGIYYFIVGDTLFYCDVYIILLRCLYYFIALIAKIDQLLQHMCRYNK